MALCLQMPAAVVLLPIFPLPQPYRYKNMKSTLELASGTLILCWVFALVSKPLQSEKHLSSKCLWTTTELNLIKDISDNKRTIKQRSFQLSTRVHIATTQRVSALSSSSQSFFSVISRVGAHAKSFSHQNQVMLKVNLTPEFFFFLPSPSNWTLN